MFVFADKTRNIYMKPRLTHTTSSSTTILHITRNDGHACAQRLVNKQQFYQTSMLKFIGVTLGK